MNSHLIIRTVVTAFVVLTTFKAHSANELKVQGDLMIHPDQISKFFDIASAKIGASQSWDWPALNFAKPYKTTWTSVAAKGPFSVRFSTADLKNQEVGLELDWNEPVVSVGRFEIRDTIVRQVGGVNLTIILDGSCNNLVIRVPSGQWKVKGNLKWAWTSQGMQVAWKDFAFSMNNTVPAQVDLGQCQGAAALQQELRKAIETVSRDQAWMQDVLKDGALDFVSSSLVGLQAELLRAREVTLKEGLSLSWVPTDLVDAGQGVLRVPGQMVITKASPLVSRQSVERSYDVLSLVSVKESGFVLPRGTLPRVVEFMQKNGELGYRAKSSEIESFVGLMQSRFLQFFVWPDLMSFPTSTQFYFDVSAQKAPVFTNGVMLNGGGIRYDVQAPLLVNQWAPSGNKYLPYVDFYAPLQGSLSAKIADGKFTIQLMPSSLDVSSVFRKEYSMVRQVTAWIATSLLGSRVSGYLESRPISFDVPTWELGDGSMSLNPRDVQLWKYSFRVPLDFKQNQK